VAENLARYSPWRIAGRYFESCNCDAICPCRRVGGRPGGRSTHGICLGTLCWLVDEGHAGEVVLQGLGAALVFRYDDDVPGSPWNFKIHVDSRGDDDQRAALSSILLGRLGGDDVLGLPWVRKPSDLLDVTASALEIASGPDGHELRIGNAIVVDAKRPVPTDETVSCIVPGHHRPGTELFADELTARDGQFQWELEGTCAFAGDFDYAS
jgi:uncharacterized protein DUF1326